MPEFRILTYPGYNIAGQGQHSVELVMALIGSEGAMVWRLALGIAPEGRYPSSSDHSRLLYGVNFHTPTDMGLSAHTELTEKTMHEEDNTITSSCEFLEGRACVCDYSTGLAGKELLPAFACEGFAGVQKILETKYREHYGKEAQ